MRGDEGRVTHVRFAEQTCFLLLFYVLVSLFDVILSRVSEQHFPEKKILTSRVWLLIFLTRS